MCLSNIAGDIHHYRDYMIKKDIVMKLETIFRHRQNQRHTV